MGQHAEDLMFYEQKMFGFNGYEMNDYNYTEENPFTHKTKDGRVLTIQEMTDEHLINTIRFKLKHIKNKTTSHDFHLTRIPYYFFEAILRDIDINEYKELFLDITKIKEQDNARD